jgi:AbrB family looped-hinge helix DNA binding protein
MVKGGEDVGETFLAEVVSSSRVTIPKPVRHKMNIQEGDEIYVKIWKDEKVSKVATKDRFYKK